MKKIRIGVFGTGRLGGFHAEKVSHHPEAELVGVYDPFEPNRKRVADKLNVPGFDSIDELLEKIDAAICACPTTLHGLCGKQILNAGKHLLIEKPVCSTSDQANQLVKLARNKGLIFTTGHVEQFNPAWTAARETLETMRTQGPIFIDAQRTSGYTFRCVDVGAVLDLMIHDLELILSLIPEKITGITAWTATEFGGNEDTAAAVLRFADRSCVRLFASRVETGATRKMTIRNSKKRVTIDFAARSFSTETPDKAILAGEYAPEKVDYPAIAPLVPAFMNEHYAKTSESFESVDALALELDDFIRSIHGEKEPAVPGQRAACAVQLAEQILAAGSI